MYVKSGQVVGLMDDLRKGKSRILLREHFWLFLKVFVAGFMLAAAFAIPLVIWTLNARIRTLKEQVATANVRREKWEEESKRQTKLAEQYRDRFLALTQTDASLAGYTHESLQVYALSIVRALQVPIREHEALVNKLELDAWSARPANAEDFQKALEERSNAEWQAGQKCMAEYNIRFKADVLPLRREILSRIPVGNDMDQNGLPTDYWYDSPWNFYGFKKMVTDLERIAKLLPVPKGYVKKPSS